MHDPNSCKILKDYLNYNSNINKSKSTINEYKYDLTNFLKTKISKYKIKITHKE